MEFLAQYVEDKSGSPDPQLLIEKWLHPTAVENEVHKGYLQIKTGGVQQVLPEDEFAQKHGFNYAYILPKFSGDRVETVLIAYWVAQPALDLQRVDTAIGTVLDVLGHVRESAGVTNGLLKLLDRYSQIILSTSLRLDEHKFDEIAAGVVERLKSLVPNVQVCLIQENDTTRKLQVSSNIDDSAPEQAWVEAVAEQLKSIANLDDESGTDCDWHDIIVKVGEKNYSGYVAAVCRQPKFRSWCAIWTGTSDHISSDDEKVLSAFAVRARDILENASIIAGWKRANRLLAKASQRFADNETLAALVDMTSGLAHDFNNIIGAAIGRTQLMKLRLQDKSFLRDIEKIETLLLEGAHTVRRIQEFSTSARYKGLKKMDLVEVVRQYSESSNQTWRALADERKITVDVQALVDEALVEGVAADIGKVMEKLIHNAVENSAEKATVDVMLADCGKYYTLSVANRGPVMSEDMQKKIFYPFFTTKPDPGAGLGLAVAHGIVIRHAGKITVQSTEESGTLFNVALPKLDPTTEDSEITNKTADIPELRVLVVDDDEQIREVLADMLMVNGHKVTTCCDGYSALEAFKKDTFDLLITDLGMAGMSGLDLAGLVHDENPDLPIAMITGWGSQLNHDEVALKGIQAVIAKPFHLNDINALVEQLAPK